jgi:hypothetical protein
MSSSTVSSISSASSSAFDNQSIGVRQEEVVPAGQDIEKTSTAAMRCLGESSGSTTSSQRSYTVESSSCSSSSSSSTASTKADLRRKLQGDISYIIVGSMNVAPWAWPSPPPIIFPTVLHTVSLSSSSSLDEEMGDIVLSDSETEDEVHEAREERRLLSQKVTESSTSSLASSSVPLRESITEQTR